jgi:hypothetical protein
MKQIVTYFSAIVLAASSSFGQSELKVDCYNTSSIYNMYSIDDQTIEYSTLGNELAFYVAVIDPSTCTAWGTNYNGANPTHSFGNLNENGEFRQRVEYYFAFRMDDSLQLEGMKNMLQSIPAGHSIVVYTPISYDYNAVYTVNSNLIAELVSKWNPGVIQGNNIMILYGVMGTSNSFVQDTTQNAGQVSFSTTICNPLAVSSEVKDEKLFEGHSGTAFTLNAALAIDELEITDAMGKKVSFVRTENTIQLPAGISSGVYVFQATSGNKIYRSKQFVSF